MSEATCGRQKSPGYRFANALLGLFLKSQQVLAHGLDRLGQESERAFEFAGRGVSGP
jgi:hypothetical protein